MSNKYFNYVHRSDYISATIVILILFLIFFLSYVMRCFYRQNNHHRVGTANGGCCWGSQDGGPHRMAMALQSSRRRWLVGITAAAAPQSAPAPAPAAAAVPEIRPRFLPLPRELSIIVTDTCPKGDTNTPLKNHYKYNDALTSRYYYTIYTIFCI